MHYNNLAVLSECVVLYFRSKLCGLQLSSFLGGGDGAAAAGGE